MFKTHYDEAVTLTPYTEWYANAIKVTGSPSEEFHRTTYGNQPYEDFREGFLDGLELWDPTEWARLFKASGARYVVLVTKHHDGYCLWPSAIANPNQQHWTSERDIVGELAQAVRAEGLRFGLYYSGGIDWTFNKEPLKTFGDFVASAPDGPYPDYATAQFRELIDRYAPDLLWNDISWPDDLPSLKRLFAYYYHTVPEGVVNDRWQHVTWQGKCLKLSFVRKLFDWLAKRHIRKNPAAVDGVIPKPLPYSDFRTPEYAAFDETQDKKWETTRGMSHSFGYNRNDTDSDYESPGSLLHGLIDAVAKNGNLLLNVGPRGVDAQIPSEQVQRLQAMGAWLASNGEAIYGTRPWVQAEGQTDQQFEVRFTQNNGKVYAIILGTPDSTRLCLLNMPLAAATNFTAMHLASRSPIEMLRQDTGVELTFRQPLVDAAAHVIVFSADSL